jgi:hypothetical protein
MRTPILIAAAVAVAAPAAAQPKKLSVGIYAPSVEFGTSSARAAYAEALAKAIAQSTGIRTEAQSYANLGALKQDNVDFAVIDGACYATNLGWRLLATATIGGGPARTYALFAAGGDMRGLQGKTLAFIATGCNDAGFIDHAMLDSEVDPAFFGARIGKSDLTAAVAEVAAVKTSQAVFAPIGSGKGLTKLFETGAVPNPAFVAIAGAKLPPETVDKVAAAALAFAGGGAIAGWGRPARDAYRAFAARLGRTRKVPVFATPEPVRFDAKDVLIEPPTIREPALPSVRGQFVRPPNARL